MRNVLLITVDSLRYDSASDLRTSPDSDGVREVARSGNWFERAYATGPGTGPSFPGILTGTLPLSHGGLGPLRADRPRLSQELSDAGLTTAGFHSNPYLSGHFHYDVGFDTFEDYQNPLMGVVTKVFPRGIELNNPKLRRLDEWLHITDGLKKAYSLVKGKPRPYVSADVITDDALSWLEGTADPFFCWVHYMDVHHPCFPPEQYRERFEVTDVSQSEVAALYSTLIKEPETLTDNDLSTLLALYRAAIAYTDDQIARLLDALKDAGRYEETLVVVTSDHGELFGEHDAYAKPPRIYDELLHVPLIVDNAPQDIEFATDALVSLVDLPPIIHDSLGLSVHESYEGKPLRRDEQREYVIAEYEVEGDTIVGLRADDWLVEVDDIQDTIRIIDTTDGAFESVPADQVDAEAADLRERALERYRAVKETRSAEAELSDHVVSRLEDLGYR